MIEGTPRIYTTYWFKTSDGKYHFGHRVPSPEPVYYTDGAYSNMYYYFRCMYCANAINYPILPSDIFSELPEEGEICHPVV